MKEQIFKDSKGRKLKSLENLLQIQKDGKNAYPYCNMKETTCFEHYREQCPNWSMYYEVKNE